MITENIIKSDCVRLIGDFTITATIKDKEEAL